MKFSFVRFEPFAYQWDWEMVAQYHGFVETRNKKLSDIDSVVIIVKSYIRAN